jgi:hypothetical protein
LVAREHGRGLAKLNDLEIVTLFQQKTSDEMSRTEGDSGAAACITYAVPIEADRWTALSGIARSRGGKIFFPPGNKNHSTS